MTFLELARRRHSLRRYDPRPVPREVLDRCCEAARLAPSACNGQPWRFVLADRDPLRARLGEAAFSGPHRMNRFALDAPVLVVLAGTPLPWTARLGAFFQGVPFSLSDAAIAGEHFVLQAEEEGLGTCWLGWFDASGVARILNLPRTERPLFLLAAGYPPEEHRPKPPHRIPLEEMRRYGD